jgi:hypothetical protein
MIIFLTFLGSLCRSEVPRCTATQYRMMEIEQYCRQSQNHILSETIETSHSLGLSTRSSS